MDEEEWEKSDVDEFSRLEECSKHIIEPNQEKMKIINVGGDKNPRELKIETLILKKYKNNLIKILKEYVDIFTWSYINMPCLNINIVLHKLSLINGCDLVKKKLKNMRLDLLIKIKEKV
jgi:hypothetical protein